MLTVSIRTTSETLFDQSGVESVSAYNLLGKFDVLTSHAHFASVISRAIEVRMRDGVKTFPLKVGLMQVKDDVVKIWLLG